MSHVTGRLSIKPESWAALKKDLEKLGEAVSKRTQEEAVLAGAKVIADEANNRAPGPHIVYDIIKYEPNPALVAAGVGPDEDHWYYRFIELGATRHDIQGNPIAFQGDQGFFIGRNAQNTGGVIARPFLRPAMESKSQAAQQAMADVIEEEMRKAV